ncbi:MAG: SRPBCC domain-containing protein [Ignavibacteriaceae bacterium]|nr:SRPBCC domain-containing protein [Ignavibacteriaceae bacterium]NUM72105.1 SRPBCC domain-containing protein [Ignavibacteriaceae bacterium]
MSSELNHGDSSREMVVIRTIKAPRAKVYEAFVSDGIENWWGPDGFTTTTFKRDVRPGGSWIYIMHGPDGTDYNNRIDYTDFIQDELIRYEHGTGDPGVPADFISEISFRDVQGGTEVTLKATFRTAKLREDAFRFGAAEGGQQTLGRLEAFLIGRQV